MAITYFGAASTPADNGVLDDTVARAITPPASMVAGDLVLMIGVCRDGAATVQLAGLGGQSWTSETLRQGGASTTRIFWCRFNGTWSANPQVETVAKLGSALSAVMAVFRPTTGTNTWAIDVAETYNNYSAPISPFDVTAGGHTAIAASTVSLFVFTSVDDNTWAIQTGGFSNAGGAQYRNTQGSDISISLAYKIQTSAGATGNVANRQATLGGDGGHWRALTFKEQSAGVTISNAGDELHYHGQTGIVIDGAGFSASGNTVKISPTDNVADGAAVTQTITAQGVTQITVTGVLSSFTPYVQLYLFVTNGTAQTNSSGFLVKRESRMYVRETLEDLAGNPTASETNIRYRVTDTTINGTLLLSGTTEVTDGSGDIEIGPYTLTEGGDLSVGDDVWVTLAIEGASQAASKGTCVKITPDYE